MLRRLVESAGSEMAHHHLLVEHFREGIFFARPASPWQRGTNENTNGLLRQYFPKGTDLSTHGLDTLHAVQDRLNHRPRKTLGWRTPAELMGGLVTPLSGHRCDGRSNSPVTHLTAAGVHEVAIGRCDGQVVDALLAAGLTVVVISPNQLANLRSRYRTSGNKDDRFDAYVLADTLRTDRARLRPLIPDTPATVALRSAVRARKDLLAHRIGLANQFRAHLEFFYPGPVGLFTHLDAPTSLRFLARFTCQDDADWLTPAGSRPGCAAPATPAVPTPPSCTPT